MSIHFNQNVFFNATVPVKISDAQIKKHIHDRRVRQLKDIRISLYLRFNKARSGGTWYFYRYENGKQHPYRLGSYPATQAKDIFDIVSAATVKIAQDQVIECNHFATVDELLIWHVEREAKKATSTRARLNNLHSLAHKHLITAFHCQPLHQLDHSTIDNALIQPMFEDGYSVSYVKAMFNLLKSAYQSAKKIKKINANPIGDIKFKDFFPDNFSITKAQMRGCYLNSDQLPVAMEKSLEASPEARLLFMMIIAHGSRLGETRKAKWKNICFKSKQWVIPKQDAKTRTEMIYPLTQEIINLLSSYYAYQKSIGYHGEYLFPVSKYAEHPAYPSLACGWIKSISQGQWSAHDLRKRARSCWQDLDIDYIVCETLLNHAKQRLDQTYIHAEMEQKKRQALETYHFFLKKSCWSNCFTPVSTL